MQEGVFQEGTNQGLIPENHQTEWFILNPMEYWYHQGCCPVTGNRQEHAAGYMVKVACFNQFVCLKESMMFNGMCPDGVSIGYT